jgi:lipopolysaccharide biosynthesis glycosyltransferase
VLFDQVIFVEYIKADCKPLRTKKQREKYETWICDSFTKWACLSFTQYDKILFLDADVVVLDNLDNLFDLPAPAGTFSSPWARGKHSGKDSGRALQSVLNDHYYGPEEIFSHGKKVSWISLKNGLENNGFVAPGTCVLLEPNNVAFNKFKSMLVNKVVEFGPYGHESCFSGFDEQSIIELYWKHFERENHHWTHIDQTYNFIPWHFKWIKGEPKVIHFFGKNVWEMDRTEWTDIQVWWNIFESIFRCGEYSDEEKAKLAEAMNDKQKRLTSEGRPPAKCFWCEAKGLDHEHHTVDPDTGRLVCPELLKTISASTEYTKRKEVEVIATSKEKASDAIDYGI